MLRYLPGDDTWYPSDSPSTRFSAVFEDNGETAYFYAYERSPDGAGRILDACQIYVVARVVDREIESTAEILWTRDGLKAALFINGTGHAVLDFDREEGYCRSNFPPPGQPWAGASRIPWSDEMLGPFIRA